jgi:lipoate-protein ligase B
MSTSETAGKRSTEGKPLWIIDLGRQAYAPARELQKRLVSARLEERIPDVLLLLEHDPVFTMGRHGRKENMLLSRQALQEKGIPFFATERGGDITYHGPGQLVGYPVLQVPEGGKKVRALVEGLEDVLLYTLGAFGIRGSRDPDNPGAWAGQAKVGSIGIAVQRGVSFHGFSLNVCMDLTPFSWIYTCGHKNLRVTSLGALLGGHVSMAKVKETVASVFAQRMAYRRVPRESVRKESAPLLYGSFHPNQR